MSARELYEKTIRQLPPMDRLQLASIILSDLTKSAPGDLDIRTDWSDEDLADLSRYSMDHADTSLGPEDVDG